MLKSNIHRFMVEEADINDPTIMKLPLTEDKIELLPKNIYFPNAVSFAKDMMILSLNELGKAFLNVDKFVSQNQPYASTRPNAE